MNITAVNLTCTNQGDGWSALQTSTLVGALFGPWSNLAAGTDIAALTHVKMWLKGVQVNGTVEVEDADNANYPELPGAAGGYNVGLIQIIKKAPIMQARFEDYKYTKWMQRDIPFFDSTGVGASPWYNTGSRKLLVPGGGIVNSVELQDYPTTVSYVREGGAPAGKRILELQKALDFDVYLAVAPNTLHYKQKGIRILQKMTWSSNTHLKFTWNLAGAVRYTEETFTRTSSAPEAVDRDGSKEIVKKFPMSAEGANEAISSLNLS
jgi:hypothetical protein